MSFQSGSRCFPTSLEANEYAAAALAGTTSGGQLLGVVSVSEFSLTLSSTSLQSGTSATVVVPSSPPPCTLLSFDDGVQAGYLVGGVWLSVYAVLALAVVVKSSWASQNDS